MNHHRSSRLRSTMARIPCPSGTAPGTTGSGIGRGTDRFTALTAGHTG